MPRFSPTALSVGAVIPDLMLHAVCLVFRTMAQRDVQPLRQERSPGPHAASQVLSRDRGPVVVGTTGFVGRANGFVTLYFCERFARELTSDILGLSAAEINREGFDLVKDAIGELTNVVAGTFKNQLCTHGLSCHLTSPIVLQGPPCEAEPVATSSRWALEYETRGARFVADVLCDSLP